MKKDAISQLRQVNFAEALGLWCSKEKQNSIIDDITDHVFSRCAARLDPAKLLSDTELQKWIKVCDEHNGANPCVMLDLFCEAFPKLEEVLQSEMQQDGLALKKLLITKRISTLQASAKSSRNQADAAWLMFFLKKEWYLSIAQIMSEYYRRNGDDFSLHDLVLGKPEIPLDDG